MNSLLIRGARMKRCNHCGEMFAVGMGGGKYCPTCRYDVMLEQLRQRRAAKKQKGD